LAKRSNQGHVPIYTIDCFRKHGAIKSYACGRDVSRTPLTIEAPGARKMNKKLFLLTFIACALPLLHAQAVAQDNYFTLSGVYTDDDAARGVKDDYAGGQITLGHFMTDIVSVEGKISAASPNYNDGVTTGVLKLAELGFNTRWSFRRDRRISPYLLAGVGVIDVKSPGNEDTRDMFYNAGAGLNWHLGRGPVSLNLEYRLRRSDDGPGYNDKITTLGLSWAFGDKPAAMPTPAAPPADPDSDGDGVPDSRDACPNTPAGHRVDSRGCSLDSDGDGVVDADDACPNTFRGATVDARGCEMDDDKDGVVNRLDECPNTVAGARVDTKGCEIKDVIELPGVNFESNSDRLLPSANSTLRDAATTLRRYPELVVEVAGHTDSDGAAEYNQGLSERRAITVRDYLINEGVRADHLSARGYGEEEPVADNTSATGKAANRRVELRIREE